METVAKGICAVSQASLRAIMVVAAVRPTAAVGVVPMAPPTLKSGGAARIKCECDQSEEDHCDRRPRTVRTIYRTRLILFSRPAHTPPQPLELPVASYGS